MTKNKFDGFQWQLLHEHVSPSPPGSTYHSTFNAALREARTLSGRSAENGKPIPGVVSATLWSGAAVYLILLEQIGCSLRPAGSRSIKNEQAIEKALRQFGGNLTTKLQRQVLYALRCAFVHRFSLMNHRHKPSSYRRLFALDNQPGVPLIRWPSRAWDNTHADAGPATSTVVNLFALCELVEQIVRNVRTMSARVKLRSEIELDELRKSYGFSITDS